MSRWKPNHGLPVASVLLCLLLLPAVLFAAPEIVVPGSVVFQLVDADLLPQDAVEGNLLRTGDVAFDEWLVTVEATSMRNEFGDLMPDMRVVRYDTDQPVEQILAELRRFPFVVQADANYAFPYLELTRTPSDPEAPGQWHHYAINSYRGWALAQGSDDIVVAIIDSGVDYIHPDLATSIWVNPGEDLNNDGVWDISDVDGIDNDDNGYVDDGIGWDFVTTSEVFPGDDPGPPDNDPDDFNGHGTHCSGDAAATTNNGIGVAAPGWGCKIGALRAGWTNTSGMGVVGLLEATSAVTYSINHGFDVISMSFGGPGGDPFYFQQALQMAFDAGLILVAAAGNEGTNVPQYPAAENMVIAVAATDQNDGLADFSSWGDWVTVSAPGVAIYSTTQAGGYGQQGGTSMACPIVAGSMANLMSIAPSGWTNDDLINRLEVTAREIPVPGTGAGIVDLGALLDMYVSVDSVWVYDGVVPHIIHGQEGTFGMRWQKRDQSAQEVSLKLTCDEPRVTLGADSLWIGIVTQGQSGHFEVPVTVAPGDEEVETIDVVARFRGSDFFNNDFDFEQVIPLRVGQAPVLLIDDDQGGAGLIDTWYLASMDQIGVETEAIKRSDISLLADFIDGYEAIIYASGNRTSNHLAGDDLAVFSGYLNNGGKMLFSGQNIAEDLAANNPDVLDTLFHVSLTEPNANQLVVRGIEGHPVTDGLYLFLAGDGGAWNQDNIDVLAAQDGAEPLFIFNADQPERLAGVRVQEGSRDLFFCSFGVEAVNDDWINASTRAEVLDRIFVAWGFETGVAEPGIVASDLIATDFAVSRLWPNPTNGFVQSVITLPSSGSVELRVFDLLGREVDHNSFAGSAGHNRFSWQMPAGLSSGMYFLRAEHRADVRQQRFLYVK